MENNMCINIIPALSNSSHLNDVVLLLSFLGLISTSWCTTVGD